MTGIDSNMKNKYQKRFKIAIFLSNSSLFAATQNTCLAAAKHGPDMELSCMLKDGRYAFILTLILCFLIITSNNY